MIKIGDLIDNRYRITSRIGTGGMAEVFEANDFVSKRIVAIKVMKEELLSDQINFERFRCEAKTCAMMHHPGIIRVFNEGTVDDRPYLAYERIKGKTLGDYIDINTKFSIKEAVQIMIQLLDAISYIHQNGIIHRDIKPQNIFFLPDGTIKLSDFGISVEANINETKVDTGIMGSICYLAPEVCEGKPASIKSDIYAAGVTFFELITGRLPYQDGHSVDIALAHIKKPFPVPSKYNSFIPKEIDRIILKACRKNPKDRFYSADEMKSDISFALKEPEKDTGKKNLIQKLFGFK